MALAAILPFLGVQATFYIYSGLLIVVFIMALFVGEETLDKAANKSNSLKDLHIGKLFKNYYFVSYLLFTVIMYCGSEAFLPYLMEEVGMNPDSLSLIHIWMVARYASHFSQSSPQYPIISFMESMPPVSYTHLDVYKRQVRLLH